MHSLSFAISNVVLSSWIFCKEVFARIQHALQGYRRYALHSIFCIGDLAANYEQPIEKAGEKMLSGSEFLQA